MPKNALKQLSMYAPKNAFNISTVHLRRGGRTKGQNKHGYYHLRGYIPYLAYYWQQIDKPKIHFTQQHVKNVITVFLQLVPALK